MKYFRLFLACSLFAVFTATTASSQHSIQVDDGNGHYTILKSQTSDPLDIFNFPVGGGTLLVTPTPGSPSLVWLTGGNTLIAGQVFGSVAGNPFDVVMQANGSEKMRLVSGGGVKIGTGSANALQYFDGTQAAGRIMRSDASGFASWVDPTTLGFVTTATGTAPITVNGDNVAHSGPITIGLTQGNLTTSTPSVTVGGTGRTVGSNISVDLTTGSLSSGGSLTIGGTGLTVGANITANINLANPNNWTGTQTITGAGKFAYVDGNQTAGFILSENGAGVATWVSPSTLSIVSTATGTAPITVNGDNAAHSGPITIALTQGSLTTSTPAITVGGTGKTAGSNITVDLTTGSVTSSGSITVGGTGKTVGSNVTADLNLANANTWTGTQTFGGAALTPNTPASLAGNTNDYALSPSISYFRISSTTAVNLTGITGGFAGRTITLQNAGANTITLKHQTGSLSGNQFDLSGGFDIIIGPKGIVSLIYDATAPGFWRVVSAN